MSALLALLASVEAGDFFRTPAQCALAGIAAVGCGLLAWLVASLPEDAPGDDATEPGEEWGSDR